MSFCLIWIKLAPLCNLMELKFGSNVQETMISNREDLGFRILGNTPAFSFKIYLDPPTTTQAK